MLDGRPSLPGTIDGERVAVWLLAALLVGVAVIGGYFATPYTAPPGALAAARGTPGVTVTAVDGGYELAPAGGDTTTGVVFYPGARVAPGAYVPVLAPVVASTDVTVVIPEAPLNLAVLNPGMADGVIEARPGIERWYIAGHSLGGAMACRFAAANPDRLHGLVLLASYCDRDVSGTDLRGLAVRGGADGVLNEAAYRRNREHLPRETIEVTIPGMNHTQFGAYSGQPGDRPASITDARAHRRLRALLVEFLRRNGTVTG